MQIQRVFQNFGGPEDIFPYSIDEGFIDLTSSLNYFVPDDALVQTGKARPRLRIFNGRFGRRRDLLDGWNVERESSLAKLALDNEAKKIPHMRANWSYEDVEEKVWGIPEMTDFWGIGSRMEKRLNALGIYSIRELANAEP